MFPAAICISMLINIPIGNWVQSNFDFNCFICVLQKWRPFTYDCSSSSPPFWFAVDHNQVENVRRCVSVTWTQRDVILLNVNMEE